MHPAAALQPAQATMSCATPQNPGRRSRLRGRPPTPSMCPCSYKQRWGGLLALAGGNGLLLLLLPLPA